MSTEIELLKKERALKNGLIFHIPQSLLKIKATIIEKMPSKKEEFEKIDVVPFSEIKMKNTPEVYKVTKSFIRDIEEGKKSFGFLSVGYEMSDLSLLGIASCLSYSRNNSAILLIVKNLGSSEWDKYRKKFNMGNLGDWKTFEWGNLCLIDYKELNSSQKIHPIDFNFIYSEFDAILWSVPENGKELKQNEIYLDILRSLDSITIQLKLQQVALKELKKIEYHYKSLGIPLKGILREGASR
jgi:hypothetical protein